MDKEYIYIEFVDPVCPEDIQEADPIQMPKRWIKQDSSDNFLIKRS